ncbi:SWIM zinc finger family protein [Marinomonas sp. RSW2]|uniref:SWIM zinc finger family protein n=1 Tax=Marinomonas maritima TaxID=2940935 RepID=A0ABT5WHN8_9GAMM|nr:SWIM zinc finger family protein [Marinomonas maritima]MDE8604329.1 SWIM zinc finger family protein [Marinomonas maritima]
MSELIDYLKTLALDEIQEWAGDKIYARGKGIVKHVSDLALTINDALSAKVQGTEKYNTDVFLEDGELTSFCSCPYEYGECKHAVAVILAAAKQLNAGKDIPQDDMQSATPRDIELSFIDNSLERLKPSSKKEALDPTHPHTLDALHKMLSKQPKAALVKQLLLLSMKNYEIEQSLWTLADKTPNLVKVKSQVDSLRRKIKKVTAEESWQDYWNHKGHTPDYSPIRVGFETLLKQNAFDEVVELGGELWTLGIEQIQHSDDEGELASELSRTMFIVLEALPKTSMKPVIQLFWWIDRELQDDYGLLQDLDLVYNHECYQIEYWQEVAMVLNQRLATFSKSKKQDYEYKRVVDMLALVYQKAGDDNAILAMMEKQVRNTQDYAKLVEAFVKQGNMRKAKEWCLVGFNDTLQSKPGIARRLKDQLIEWHKEEGDITQVAALLVDDFLASPTMENFQIIGRLFKTKAPLIDGLWASVRTTILDLVEHGDPATDVLPADWPLPKPDVSSLVELKGYWSQTQIEDLMIKVAVHEQHFDEAVDRFGNRVGFQIMTDSLARSLAIAVSISHPETSINIWKACTLTEIAATKASAYQRAGKYLLQLRKVYEQHQRLDEWLKFVKSLKAEHKRKIRLQEVLDKLLSSKRSAKLIE